MTPLVTSDDKATARFCADKIRTAPCDFYCRAVGGLRVCQTPLRDGEFDFSTDAFAYSKTIRRG